jgi:hypothetical protein
VGLSWRLERLYTPLAPAGWPMRVFRATIAMSMLAVFHSWQELSLGGPIALQLVGGDHQGDVREAFEQLHGYL